MSDLTIPEDKIIVVPEVNAGLNHEQVVEVVGFTPEQEHKLFAEVLTNFCMTLTIFSTEKIKEHVERSRKSISMRDAVGHIIDPTAYRNGMNNGTHDSQAVQLQIAEHLLRVRVLMDRLTAIAAAHPK